MKLELRRRRSCHACWTRRRFRPVPLDPPLGLTLPLLSYVIPAHAPWDEGCDFGVGRKGREAVLGPSLTTTAQTGSRVNMATCADILRSEFPEIDGQVFDYVTGERN